MPDITVIRKACCEAILKAWLERGSDIRHLDLAHKPDLYDAKRSIENYASCVSEVWLRYIIHVELKQGAQFVGGYTSRWPAHESRDKGVACVPPLPDDLLGWEDENSQPS